MILLSEASALMARLNEVLRANDDPNGTYAGAETATVAQVAHNAMALRTYVHDLMVALLMWGDAALLCGCPTCVETENAWQAHEVRSAAMASMTPAQVDAWLESDTEDPKEWLSQSR